MLVTAKEMNNVLLLCTFIIFYSCNSTDLFMSSDPIKVGEITLSCCSNVDTVLLYKSFSNASVNESIQIRTRNDTNEVVAFFERFDEIVSTSIDSDELKLILKDTSGWMEVLDTFYLNCESIFDCPPND